jgi:hypothetical protein
MSVGGIEVVKRKGTRMSPVTLRSKNGFQLQEAEADGAEADRMYIVMSPDGEEVLFESSSRPEAEKAFEHLTS